MGAIDNWMRKHGYAKLDQYGLVLTPDDRILSTRPAVLDDGLGGKIVGWVDGDLAAMELDRWRPADMPAAKKAATPKALPAKPAAVVAPTPVMVPPSPPVPAPMPAYAAPSATPQPMPVLAMPAPKATPAPIRAVAAPPAEVAALPPVEEDEWEWEIAMARARAVAMEVAEIPAAQGFSRPTAPAPKMSTRTKPMAAVAVAKPEPLPAWPETEPYNEQWADATATEISHNVMSPIEKTIAAVKTADKRVTAEKRTQVMAAPPAPAATRSTVIPVPTLPVSARPGDVRPPSYARPMSARTRMARGTGREDTIQTTAIAGAYDDQTSPYVTLPSEVRGPGHANTRRVAAKQR